MPYSYAPVDIVFLLILLFFVITAASRGLIKEFFGKAAFVAGIVIYCFVTDFSNIQDFIYSEF